MSILIWSCLYGASALAGTNLETERAIGTVIIIDNEKRVLEEAGTQPSAPGHLPEPSEPEAVETTISHNVAVLPQIGYNPQAGIILGQQCKLHRL